MCDHRDLDDSLEEFHDQVIRPKIDCLGWFIHYVNGEGNAAPYAYTIGLTEHGYTELVATGVKVQQAAALRNDGGDLLHHRQLLHGERVTVSGRRVAGDVYGSALRAVQLVHADDSGVWPWCRTYRGGNGGAAGARAAGGASRA